MVLALVNGFENPVVRFHEVVLGVDDDGNVVLSTSDSVVSSSVSTKDPIPITFPPAPASYDEDSKQAMVEVVGNEDAADRTDTLFLRPGRR